ncbi:MAG: ankyrin repeat domain-containing protein [Thermoanaerobaculia bacterium]
MTLGIRRRAILGLGLSSLLLSQLACGPGSHAGRAAGEGGNVPENLAPELHFSGAQLALARAAMAGDREEVARLVAVEQADPNASTVDGTPLLAWPMLADSVAGVEALLDARADPNLPVPGHGSAIALAARAENPAILVALLDHGGDPDAMNDNREPLWYVAAVNRRWDNIRLLVERGADVNLPAHRNPANTLVAFYSSGQFEKVHWLLEHGADPGYRIAEAAAPDRVGARPVVEHIYWWPTDAEAFPEKAAWQTRCQEWLAARGYERPPEPAWLARMTAPR